MFYHLVQLGHLW